jgi:uncharacterized phiE125 gp8 family phage protein
VNTAVLAPILVTPPAQRIVSLADAKVHVRAQGNEEDALIEGMIATAEAHLDGWEGELGRALVTQTWREDFAGLSRSMRLRLFPVASITSVIATSSSGDDITIDAANYRLLKDTLGFYIQIRDLWAPPPIATDRPDAVRITYVAGQPVAEVPPPIKTAALLIVGDLWRNRGASVPAGIVANRWVEKSLANYRRWNV